MSSSPQESLSHPHRTKRPVLLLAILIGAGFAVAAGAMAITHRRAPSAPLPVASAATTLSTTLAAAPAPTGTQTLQAPVKVTPQPDPNFVRPVVLKLPGVTSPEAQRVLQDLQAAYRCMHMGNKRALAAWLSPGDAPTSAEELSASMQRSLAKLPDACYVTTALPQVVNPRTPAPLMEVLFQDLDSRPDPIRLRTLFLIAGIESHPRSGEALAGLQALLNTDYQRDWSRWDQAISDQLTRETHGLRGVSCRIH